MMEMSNRTGWITFDELLNKWNKMPHEIFDYMKLGLQPYSPRGRQIIDRKTLPREYNGLWQIEKTLKSVTAKKLFWDHRKELKETSFPTEPYEKFDFTFPIDEKKADSAIAKARTFTFKIDDANEFAKQNGLPLVLVKPTTQYHKEPGATIDDYIAKKRIANTHDDVIAFELHDKFMLTYLDVARKLGWGNTKDCNVTVGSIKKRGERACRRGEKILIPQKK